ncbi:hypothetical protein OROMI_016616 [Orobanche minor]
MQSFLNKLSQNRRNFVPFTILYLVFGVSIFVTKKLFQNRSNFYNNIPTYDIRLFMQSFLNELSPNGRNLSVFLRFYNYFLGQNFRNQKIGSEWVEFLQQYSYMNLGNRTNFYNNIRTRDIRLFMQSLSNELSSNSRNLGVFLGLIVTFWGPIFITRKLFQNRMNFYNNVPTCDIRLSMQSLSNELSQNSQNLGVFLRFNSYFLRPSFHNQKNVSESDEFLQQYSYIFWGLDFCNQKIVSESVEFLQ